CSPGYVPVIIVYQPTPVLGGKACTMPLSPRTPEAMRDAYVGIAPCAAYFSIKSGRIPSDEKNTIFLLRVESLVPAAAAGAAAAAAVWRINDPINVTLKTRDARPRGFAPLRRPKNVSCIPYPPVEDVESSLNQGCGHAGLADRKEAPSRSDDRRVKFQSREVPRCLTACDGSVTLRVYP